MKPKGLIEVVLYVKNMQSQVAFYRDILGLAVSFPTSLEDYSSENWVTFKTGACTLALHSGGEGRSGQGTPTIVFAVDDIQAARDHLISHGLKMSNIRQAAPGIQVCDGRDPENNSFSIESQETPLYG